MPTLRFLPQGQTITVEPQTKILVAANKNKIDLRYGCGAARCGTCGIKVSGGELAPMTEAEKTLLTRLKLSLDGNIRLACQTRVISGDVDVDLGFQDEYSSDIGFEEG
jgi:ferredoxin